MYIVIFR